MSRRSLISAEENLIRSQRRGVPNVRMWSEQETPPQVAWDGYEEEPLWDPAVNMDGMYWAKQYNEIGANGVHGVLPAQYGPVTVSMPNLGDVTGFPAAMVVVAGLYTDVSAPGWTTAMKFFYSDAVMAVFTVDSHAGQAFAAYGSGPVGPAGNARMFIRALVADKPEGRFTAQQGTPGDVMTFDDPGPGWVMQCSHDWVDAGQSWSPPLPSTMVNTGAYWEGFLNNGALGDPGWYPAEQVAAQFEDQPRAIGTYTPTAGGGCAPFIVRFGG